MKILALDTSTAACSAALWLDGESLELFEISSKQHSELILPMVDKIMHESGVSLHQCDALAVGEGPGSFTGLRVGVAAAQGLAFGVDLPVIPVSSLLAQANRHLAAHSLCAFDARMSQLYWGLYQLGSSGLMQAVTEVMLSAAEEIVLNPDYAWTALGTGCDRYRTDLKAGNAGVQVDFVSHSFPHATDVARIAVEYYAAGRMIAAEQLAPHYVRNKVTN